MAEGSAAVASTSAPAASSAPQSAESSTQEAQQTASQQTETATKEQAAEKEPAEKSDEKKKPSSRDRMKERYRKSRTDVNWDDESADIDLEGMAMDELESFDKDRAARADMDAKMNKLFGSDSRASKIFVDWANGRDPIENLLETYGDDFTEALQSAEGKEKFKTALENWRKGKAAEAEHQKSYDSNIEESSRNLVSFADKHGLSDDAVKSIVEKAHQLASDALEGKYSEEILEMVYKAGKYDKAVEEAREEGRVNGKNETIERELRKSKPKTNLPPTAGGQEAIATQPNPQKPSKGSLSMFGGIPIKAK